MKNYRYLLIVVFLLLYVSCDDNILEKSNRNTRNSESFYANLRDGIKAVNAVYAGLQRNGLYAHHYQLTLDCLSDELAPTNKTVGAGSMNELLSYEFGPNTEFIRNFWTDSYVTIGRANIALDRLPRIPILDNERERLTRAIAEARFIRGTIYLKLVQNFGNIPLRTELNLAEIQLAPSDASLVYQFVEDDLKFAMENLPNKGEWPEGDIGRATAGAAAGILSRAYLYQKKYDLSYATAKRIIDGEFGSYTLLENRRHLHDGQHENNEETLFEVQFAFELNGGGGAWAIDQNTGWGGNSEGQFRSKQYGTAGKVEHAFYNAVPSPALLSAYTPGDPRIEAFFFTPNSKLYLPEGNPDKNPTDSYAPIFALRGYAWKKYQNEDLRPTGGTEPDDSGINQVIIRYAEVLLIAAEALIESNTSLGEAAEYINQVRRAADPTGTILAARTGGQAELRNYLRQERQVELSGEQHRRIDIVRWGIAPQVLGSKFTVGKHELLPIPQAELDANRLMPPGNY